MTAARGENAGVRLHVGGLARGLDPKELAALIAAALPSGASPTAEIMRDASTGIERGFGYVSIPAGEGVKAGAEKAIAAYDGSRWRGNRIRVSIAKGDYLQRLKAEWDEAAEAKEAAALAAVARKSPAAAPYKARQSLRLRRRPGERIILVDPTPIEWAKSPRQDARAWKKAKEAKEAEERETEKRTQERKQRGEGEEDEEEEEKGPHRRKRGVLGARRRVEFPGREATCSTKCRELWRRHLQERGAEASAARLRSVDRLISGQGEAAAATAATAPGTAEVQDAQSKGALSQAGATEKQHAVEYMPVEGAADLAPEELPLADDIEFVWDDPTEETAGSGSDDVGEDEASGDGEVPEDDEEQHQHEGATLRQGESGKESQTSRKEAEASDGDGESPTVDPRWPAVNSDDHAPLSPPKVSATGGGAPTGRATSKKLERLGNNHGLELDDRLVELLSDGSDGDDSDEKAYGEGGYDYELETAKAAGVAATNAAGEGTVEGMADRLQAETERNLGVLAQLFGGDSARPAGGTSGASSSSAGGLERGGAFGSDKTSDATALPAPPTVETGAKRGDGGGAPLQVCEQQQQQQQQEGGGIEEGNVPLCRAGVGTGRTEEGVPVEDKEGQQEEERFVAHMPSLTDIFKVQDKVSAKKNKAEKEKDKGFKIASLFDSVKSAETGPGAGATGAEAGGGGGGGGFSFAFGSETTKSSAAVVHAGEEGGINPMAAEGRAAGAGLPTSNDLIPCLKGGLSSSSNSASPSSALPASTNNRSHPGLTPPSAAAGAIPGTQSVLWRPLGDVVAVAARFVRTGKREDVEVTWLGERRSLTQDFKRKHKDAVKGRRGAGGAGSRAVSKKRRR
ncbi:unnamed protein product [Pylaiella littoralis]